MIHAPRVGLKTRGPANLAGAWSAQPVAASPRPPRAAHRPAAARAPRTTPGCTCGHGSAPPTAPRPRANAGGGPWRRIAPSCRPMAGRRPRMTRAHDRHITLRRGGTSSGRHAAYEARVGLKSGPALVPCTMYDVLLRCVPSFVLPPTPLLLSAPSAGNASP